MNELTVDWQKFILHEITNGMSRNAIAVTYRILMENGDTGTDWKAINAAIISRWSLSALEYIKQRAHRGVV